MGITPDRAVGLARFLEAYANTCAIDARRGQANDDGQFAFQADEAVSLREAAQWLLYIDSGKSAQLLARAGELYWKMRQPFGLYLRTISGAEVNEEELSGAITAMMRMAGRSESNHASNNSLLQQAIVHPQQQAYLMLAYSGLEIPLLDVLPYPQNMMEVSPHNFGVIPVGALGTPISRLWTIAMHLIQGGDEALGVIAHHLGLMCQRYQETMYLAQTNTYLWDNGASPVEVGDIDIVGIAALTTQRFGRPSLIQAMENLKFTVLFEAIGMAPVQAGIELAEHNQSHHD